MKPSTKSLDKQLDEIYDAIDALMTIGAWEFLDDLFVYWDSKVWRTDLDILLALATASLPAKSKLPFRERFMETCLNFYPDPELWKGLL